MKKGTRNKIILIAVIISILIIGYIYYFQNDYLDIKKIFQIKPEKMSIVPSSVQSSSSEIGGGGQIGT